MPRPILTVCITCYYKTDLLKLKKQVISLFDLETTPVNDINYLIKKYLTINKFEQIDSIILKEPIELIFMIDNFNISKETYENNVNDIENFTKSINRHNLDVSIYKTVKNTGVSVTRNIAIKNAKGRYICFCDDDDIHININSMIDIIYKNLDYYCINCRMGCRPPKNYTKNENFKCHYEKSNISPCSGIFDVNFLNTYSIYFPEFVKTEDIIWRSMLYYYLSLEDKTKIIECREGIYIPLISSNSSTEVIINNSSQRYPLYFTKLDLKQIKTNEYYYKKLDNIFKSTKNKNTDYISLKEKKIIHQSDIKKLNNNAYITMTEWKLFAISAALFVYQGNNIIKNYLENNIELLSNKDLKLIELSKSMNNYYLPPKSLTYNQFKECVLLYFKYISINDMISFIREVNVYLNVYNILFAVNTFWKLNYFMNHGYEYSFNLLNQSEKRYVINFIKFLYNHNFKCNSYNNFIFRFFLLINLPDFNINMCQDNNLINIVTQIRELDKNMLRRVKLSEFIWYLVYNSKTKEDLFKNYRNEIIITNTDLELKDILINKFGEKYTEIINKYIKESSLQTTDFFQFKYKGDMTVLLFYLLTPIIDQKKERYLN